MSGHMKMHLTDVEIVVRERGHDLRSYAVARTKAPRILELLDREARSMETAVPRSRSEDKSIPWREAIKHRLAPTEGAAMLRAARHREGFSQIELAKALGVRQPDISSMEKGKRPIGKEMAKRIEKVLQIDYRVFL